MSGWWLCPNDPRCLHGAVIHDGDGYDEPFICCAEGCACGKPAMSTVHECPPGSSALTPCCDRTPFELPRTDRMTLDPTLVTCGKP